jgi:transcriptional regulator with XRE-family HTH domain
MTVPEKEPIDVRLKRLRDARLLTQTDLSRESGVPLPTIKDIERGATLRPRNNTLRALSLALQVDPQYLLRGIQ